MKLSSAHKLLTVQNESDGSLLLLRGKNPALAFEEQRIIPSLKRREQVGSLRRLTPYFQNGIIDFSSNDYLGLAQNHEQHCKVEQAYKALHQETMLPSAFANVGSSRSVSPMLLGSTGSRLLTGDSIYAHDLEQRLAKWHKRPAALLCNSGYDANLAVMSAVTMNSHVIMDELSHNSLQMGVRLSRNCDVQTFLHNNVSDLQRLLEEHKTKTNTKTINNKPVLIVLESVYSMDGDLAPLEEILNLALEYQACVILDEAHGLGVYGEHGMGVLERDSLENHPALLCSIHTFGKAAGCHGAVICGSLTLKEYLINYGRSIVYSTSLPIHSLVTIACSYESMVGALGQELRTLVRQRVQSFRRGMESIMTQQVKNNVISLLPTTSPIQALLLPGNTACIDFCKMILEKSKGKVRLYPIRSPTVPKGEERVRIIVHSHNTEAEIVYLISLIKSTLKEMGYLQPDGSSRLQVRSRL